MPEGIRAGGRAPGFSRSDSPRSSRRIGQTQFGMRRVAVGLEGSFKGPEFRTGTVTSGALDFELTLANETIEIEQALVPRPTDVSYIYLRNGGNEAQCCGCRVVMDFEAPNDIGDHAGELGLRSPRRELNASAKALVCASTTCRCRLVSAANAMAITKPADVAAQPWDYRRKDASEQQGEMLITENVTLGPSQSVGSSKRALATSSRITGGTLSRTPRAERSSWAEPALNSFAAGDDRRALPLAETDDGEIIIVRNGGSFGGLVPTFETRVDGPYAYLTRAVRSGIRGGGRSRVTSLLAAATRRDSVPPQDSPRPSAGTEEQRWSKRPE